ncbi:hypothetical protein Bca52824_023264 [Brassica carinata]|uniref:Uncharacterized protein n=1 Tax=Brassica carinata TaxID=52824 RepID=A0A8X8AU69_BRACI|nr:hypothetical protein Bca52824_023264 [Brassica carinata]
MAGDTSLRPPAAPNPLALWPAQFPTLSTTHLLELSVRLLIGCKKRLIPSILPLALLQFVLLLPILLLCNCLLFILSVLLTSATAASTPLDTAGPSNSPLHPENWSSSKAEHMLCKESGNC